MKTIKIILIIVIVLFSSNVYSSDTNKWLGKTNSKGHFTTFKKYRKSTIPKYRPIPTFKPYPNVYWDDGEGKKHHLGKYDNQRMRR